MMTLKINSADLTRLAKKLDPEERNTALIKGLNLAGFNMQHWIMRERLSAPPGYSDYMLHVITGRLRGSIATGLTETQKHGDAYILKIGTNVDYAAKHEYGIGVRKRPFMRAAVEDKKNQDDTLVIITKAIQEALDKE